MSKTFFQTLITIITRHIVNELENTEKTLFGKYSSSKIKHETFCNNYKGGGLTKY